VTKIAQVKNRANKTNQGIPFSYSNMASSWSANLKEIVLEEKRRGKKRSEGEIPSLFISKETSWSCLVASA